MVTAWQGVSVSTRLVLLLAAAACAFAGGIAAFGSIVVAISLRPATARLTGGAMIVAITLLCPFAAMFLARSLKKEARKISTMAVAAGMWLGLFAGTFLNNAVGQHYPRGPRSHRIEWIIGMGCVCGGALLGSFVRVGRPRGKRAIDLESVRGSTSARDARGP